MNENQKPILLQDLGTKYPKENSKQKRRYGLYKCFCGNEFKTQIQYVNIGDTKSCGCLHTTHNLTNHRLYKVWYSIIQRCTNPKNKDYKNYGGRGISVCNEWLDINNFINDMFLSFAEGLTIDRENNDLDYNKNNCRWANITTQARNKRKIMCTNTSGYRGVSWHKVYKKWRTRITINNKLILLGYFDNAIDGAKAYDKYVTDNNLEHTKNFN